MAIPTYTGGTGIKAPRVSPSLDPGSRIGAWISVASGALKAASGFDFVWQQRADEKRANSTAAKNRLLLTHNAQMRDLARDAIDDPDQFGKRSDSLVRSHLAEWDRARENDEISVADHAAGTSALLTGQASYRKSIDDRWLREADKRKVEEAELAAAEQVANPTAVGSGLASADGETNGIAANQMATAETAMLDPMGPWASQGPAAQQLALNDYKREVSKAAISSRVMTVYGQGGDVGPMIQELRERRGLRNGAWGFRMPSGLRVGALLGAPALDQMADDLEADIARLERQKVQQGNGAADDAGMNDALRIMEAVDAYKENRIDAATFAAMGPGLDMTNEQTMKYLGQADEPSSSQREYENAIRPVFDETLAEMDLRVRQTNDVQPYTDRMMEIGVMEREGRVSEAWANARRNTLRHRIDTHLDLGGTLSVGPSEAKAMDRIRDAVGARSSNTPGDRGIYVSRSEEFGDPVFPAQRLGAPQFYEGDFVGDRQRGEMIVAYAQRALDHGMPPETVEFTAALSINAGGNGNWIAYAKRFGSGDGGVEGAQDLWRTSPKTALHFFPHVSAQEDRIRYDAKGGLDTRGTRKVITDQVEARIRASESKLRWNRGEPRKVSMQEIKEAMTPKDWVLLGFTTSVDRFLAWDPPLSAGAQKSQFDTLSKELKTERELAEQEGMQQ